MRAIPALARHVVAQKASDQRSEEGHRATSVTSASAAAAMSVISSGVA